MNRNVLVAIAVILVLGAYVVLATTRGAMHIAENDPPPPPSPTPDPAPTPDPDDPERRTHGSNRRVQVLSLPAEFSERRAAERRAL